MKIHFKREYFIKLVLEVFSVIFAVLLALFVNEWRQSRADKRIADKALENVIDEILENKTKIDSTLIHQQQMLLTLDSAKLALENRKEDDTTDINFGVVSLTVLSEAAWTTIKSTNVINYMDFAKVMRISKLYKVQGFYSEIVDRFMNDPDVLSMYLLSRDDIGFEALKKQLLAIIDKFHLFLSRSIDLGRQLNDSYRTALEELGYDENLKYFIRSVDLGSQIKESNQSRVRE